MKNDDPLQIWADDARRAAATCALVASNASPREVGESILAGLESGRPITYVLALLQSLTMGIVEQLQTPETAAAFQKVAAQLQLHEDDLRNRGEWRQDDNNPEGGNDHG